MKCLHVKLYALQGGRGLTFEESLNCKWRVWLLPVVHYETDLRQGKLTSDLFYCVPIKLGVPACSSRMPHHVTAETAASVMPKGAHHRCRQHCSVWVAWHNLRAKAQAASQESSPSKPEAAETTIVWPRPCHIQATQKSSQGWLCLIFFFRVPEKTKL